VVCWHCEVGCTFLSSLHGGALPLLGPRSVQGLCVLCVQAYGADLARLVQLQPLRVLYAAPL